VTISRDSKPTIQMDIYAVCGDGFDPTMSEVTAKADGHFIPSRVEVRVQP
jgi:hypothetical protein